MGRVALLDGGVEWLAQEAMRAFVGMQPRLTQVPPEPFRARASMMATFLPRSAQRIAEAEPPGRPRHYIIIVPHVYYPFPECSAQVNLNQNALPIASPTVMAVRTQSMEVMKPPTLSCRRAHPAGP